MMTTRQQQRRRDHPTILHALNGRLLLGLKGTISEMERHTIRARLTARLLNKAERGELGLILPVGLVRDAAGLVVKNPDREVQARLELVFATFLRRRSAAKVLRSLNEGGLALPRRGRLGGVLWRPPTVLRGKDLSLKGWPASD